ncbi:LssY C-terminal domain-containing protein [Cupriavidus sp. IK-TO18]|uniref:LssY C-terminal domain-containing protein n=1 Tax=Cupriavidus sp. IK-TO18 TaxID=2782182 RepID=UPI001897E7ED|nr:LssY C-terminal domain-containing protein [Cupriavidus sp. IK-TO18]MBF6991990.1 LssY C-terminal domain-containing protein [Cupriavidus sp. IK-TO18]
MKCSGTHILAVLFIACSIAGCAATPADISGSDYRSRAMTRVEGALRVSAAVLSAEESARLYGVPLAQKKIQPVWIEVQNHGDRNYFLMSPGMDPNFFPASEGAEAFADGAPDDSSARVAARFDALAFRNPIPPGQTVSGFVLTNLNAAVKLVQLDLVANSHATTFSILIPVPGFQADYKASNVFLREIYPPEQIVDYTDDAAFRAALEALPCCSSNQDGSKNGDPLNLVIVGGLDDAFPALVRRGWRPTEQKWSGAIMKMITSAMSGERYANAPVSDLYVFGRAQDLALQKARDTIHQRNHLRLWLAPIRYHGKSVWIGQISRDIGVRLTLHSSTLVTHKIDPDVDEARAALAEDMAYSQNLAKVGFVAGVGAAPPDAPRQNLTTDPYYTTGYRVVLVFDRTPTLLSGIRLFPWDMGDALRFPAQAINPDMNPGAKP